jgi:hypothetical protein
MKKNPTEQIPPKEDRPPVHASDEQARRGKTACDSDCVGEGREGYLAEEYPGNNPLRAADREAAESNQGQPETDESPLDTPAP